MREGVGGEGAIKVITVQTVDQRDAWNDALRALPYAHVLQTWEWGAFKHDTTGWHPQRYVYRRGDTIVAAASVGVRSVGPFKVMYVSKGPAMPYDDREVVAAVLEHLQSIARRQRAIWLKIDPDVIYATGEPDTLDDLWGRVGVGFTQSLETRGWRFSNDQVQFRNTIALDLTRSADDILASMSQNTRRKVRTAEKKGVTVRAASLDDLDTLYALYRVTGARDGFLIRPPEYYEKAWRDFMRAGLAQAFIAESEGQPIAHVILFHFARTCWYFYGASSNEQREKMPNYALQWAAIQWAQAQGYTTYDFWGAPDAFDESDSMWGVYEFKRGFRGEVRRHIGAWDYAPNALLYHAYTRIMPRVIGLMKRRAGT